VGDQVLIYALSRYPGKFDLATPDDWEWRYVPSGETYWVWHFTEVREKPLSFEGVSGLARLLGVPPPGGPVRLPPILPPRR
jgi:hypothetical protein